MIIATAGHVDHGKTLLVKALTGVDADRLPEEKKRGMTIDLGFAYLPIKASEPVGFIDVPGHERFVHNMLAGVAGIDFVLLVIAADDGPMPQTEEHLAILDLLSVREGAVALTKIDRVSTARQDEVREEIARLLAPTTLARAPIFPVSAVTGLGIDALKAHLSERARTHRRKAPSGNFRLAIDRCFSISGAGCVVTGTAVAGRLAAGEPVRILGAGLSLRARTIHAQNAQSESGAAGQRCAINLAGPELKMDRIERGDWVVTGNVPAPVQKFDARLRVRPRELRPLAHWTPVHVHLGAADVTGRIAILEGPNIAPGASRLVQIALDRPIGALFGDGLIIRDQSAQRTIGGGRVVDIFPPARGRAKPERLDYLRAMDDGDAGRALYSLLRSAPRGLNLTSFAQNRNLTPDEAARLETAAAVRKVETPSGTLGFSSDHWQRLKAAITESLAASHRRSPNAIPNEERVFLDAGIRASRELRSLVILELAGEGVLIREPSGVRLSTHVTQLSPADALLWKKIDSLVKMSPLRPPPLGEIAAALGMDRKKTESFLARVSRLGLLVRISDNRFFSPAGLREHGKIAEEIAGKHGGAIIAATLRDSAGIGRTLAIEVLEYFDRIKFTRRVGDEHRLLRSAREALGETTSTL